MYEFNEFTGKIEAQSVSGGDFESFYEPAESFEVRYGSGTESADFLFGLGTSGDDIDVGSLYSEGNDVSGGDYGYDHIANSLDIISSAYADVSTYSSVLPSANLVAICEDILDGVGSSYYFANFASNQDFTLYYGGKPDSSNGTISLNGDVNYVRVYATYSSSTGYTYHYIHGTTTSASYVLSDNIVYTNIQQGYPDIGTKPQSLAGFCGIVLSIILAYALYGLFIKRHTC